jgi:glycosyltransferase involved in cell wall biosynthesis
MDNLPISVIVITKNSESDINKCLLSIKNNNPAEIILVDGNSTDGTVNIAQIYTDKIYSDNDRGESYARQLGAELASQEYIVYVDSDAVLTEGALSSLLSEFIRSAYISIKAIVLPGGKITNYWQWGQEQHNKFRHVENNIGMLTCIFRRDTILKFQFDLSPRGLLDDSDLEYRLKKNGYKFGISSATVFHPYRATFKEFVKRRFKDGRGMSRFIRKNGPWHKSVWPPLHMVYWIGISLIKGKPKLIPYFIVNGTAQTAGMIKGFFEISSEAFHKNKY